MTVDERLALLTALPNMHSEFVRITRAYREAGNLGWELKLMRIEPTSEGISFYGDTVHDALVAAETALL